MRDALAQVGGPRVGVLVRLDPPATARHWPALAALAEEAGATLLLHARAAAGGELPAGAAGVHVPDDGGDGVAVARARCPSRLVGASCHGAAGLRAAAHAGADYATLSPLFRTPGKGRPLGLEAFETIAATIDLPVLALGGLDADRARSAIRHGAYGVAVIRAVSRARSPASAAEGLLAEVDTADPTDP